MKKALLTTFLACATGLICHAQHAFNLGGDISMLPQYESAKTPYYSSKTSTTNQNVINFLSKRAKFNSLRVRLFVNPTPTEDDPTLVQDLNYVTALGKRIKDAQLDFMLDIHYSDTWADPLNQHIPSTWTTQTNAALADSMYSYTKRVLEHMTANGATPDFVQIGNEISYGMLWRKGIEGDKLYKNDSNWGRFHTFLKAAAKAVREVTPDAKIILHIERAGNTDACVNFFTDMKNNSIDYDIIGLSYYPFWHNTLANLSNTLNTLETKFPDKPVQIVETAYFYSYPEGDRSFDPNNYCSWDGTPEGQKQFIEDLCTELAQHNNVTGLYYWFPEENGNGKDKTVLKTWLNRGLWNNETHVALPALFSLQNFLTLKEAVGIQQTKANNATTSHKGSKTYTLAGQDTATPSPRSIYLKNGKKYMKR
jgi:arabinogalactan endo-1,4-beta-galactosidase